MLIYFLFVDLFFFMEMVTWVGKKSIDVKHNDSYYFLKVEKYDIGVLRSFCDRKLQISRANARGSLYFPRSGDQAPASRSIATWNVTRGERGEL